MKKHNIIYVLIVLALAAIVAVQILSRKEVTEQNHKDFITLLRDCKDEKLVDK